MITAIRVELLKLRTTKLWLGLLAAAVGLNSLVATVTSSKAGGTGSLVVPPLNTASGLRMVLTGTGFSLLISMVLGAIIATGEFRNQTITDTYLDQPHRTRVLLAKLFSSFIVGALTGLIAISATTGIGLAFVSSKGFALALATKTILSFIFGGALAAGLLAMLGTALGTLIRNQIATIITVLVWGSGAEQVIGSLSDKAALYLPFTAAVTMAGARAGEGMPQLPLNLTALPFIGAAGVLAALVAVFSLVAAHTSTKLDVS